MNEMRGWTMQRPVRRPEAGRSLLRGTKWLTWQKAGVGRAKGDAAEKGALSTQASLPRVPHTALHLRVNRLTRESHTQHNLRSTEEGPGKAREIFGFY